MIFLQILVHNELFSFVNSCSYLLGVRNADISYLNVSNITNLGNLNVSTINTSYVTN